MACGRRSGTEDSAWNLASPILPSLRRVMGLVHFFLWRSLSAGPEIAARNRTGANLRSSRPTPISNRELELLERRLSCCKERKATVSNREHSTVQNFAAPSPAICDRIAVSLRGPRVAGRRTRPPTTFLPGLPAFFSEGLPRPFFAKGSLRSIEFLTGSGSRTEIAVTHSKQMLGKFLTGARIAHIRFAVRDFLRVLRDNMRGSQCRNFLRLAFLRS